MNKLALGVCVLALAGLTACGGGSIGTTNPPTPPPLQPTGLNDSATITSTQGASFDLAMSTSFQPAEWDDTFFCSSPSACTSQTWSNPRLASLGNLEPQHIRLQGISQGVPQGAAGSTSTGWDFTVLDSITQPVLSVADHSPEFQIAKAPPFMYVNDDSSQSFTDLSFQQLAGYAKNLVQYYDTGGFTDSDGTFHVSPAYPNQTITWWGIYNEPSINNNLTDTEYVAMYNAVVPAMQSVDSNLKFVALELCCSSESWVTTFAQNLTPGLPVDAVATHYYSACNATAQSPTDAEVFGTVPGFASSVQTIYANLATNPALANVPVWITENNVNADYDQGGGISACTGKPFVTDKRGSSPFFAAWRPYVFSQVGKAGARALYHWDFDADAQYGEVDYNTGQTQLSYWVDYWLARMFPGSSKLLQYTNSDNADIEILPVVNADGSLVIMVANHAVASASDNNGQGQTAKVALDISALGPFTSASEIVIDSTTSPTTGPTAANVSPSSPINLTLNGYSVAMIKLVP